MIGFFNCVKPTGVSSNFVLSKIKKAIGQKYVGHLGTLDPAASGVLPVAVGKAAKFFDYFLNKDKVYFAVLELGVLTTTLDSEGEILETREHYVWETDIQDVLSEFVGQIEQIPPMYSAIKINGRNAYELARAGEKVEIAPRKINVYSIDLLDQIDHNKFSFRIHCSAGTYIRTLLADIARKVGEIGNVPVIIREKSGAFDISSAITIKNIEDDYQKCLISVEDVFPNLPRVEFDACDHKKVVNGMMVPVKGYKNLNCSEFLGYIGGKLFGLFECDGVYLKCKINLYEGE